MALGVTGRLAVHVLVLRITRGRLSVRLTVVAGRAELYGVRDE